jgi:hypothetical protein
VFRMNTTPCDILDITYEAFIAYEEVRLSGDFNMIMNASLAAEAADLGFAEKVPSDAKVG